MNYTITETTAPAYAQAMSKSLTLDDLRRSAPAVFAGAASERTKPTYRFINTHGVLQALMDSGFQLATARQTRSRNGTDAHARRMIRLRPMRTILTLDDCIPEICLINAHDGTSAYQLLAGLYRPLSTNGLLSRMGDFAMIRIPYRANVPMRFAGRTPTSSPVSSPQDYSRHGKPRTPARPSGIRSTRSNKPRWQEASPTAPTETV
jgi:hypothetical protein